MQLAKVIGKVVSTTKAEGLTGLKLLLVQAGQEPAFVAADTVGAGEGDTVLTVSGGACRQLPGWRQMPVDQAIVAIVDTTVVYPSI